MPKLNWPKILNNGAWLLVGGLLFALGYDYYITRARARNGQVSFEFLQAKFGQRTAPQLSPPTPAPTPAPTEVPARGFR